MTTSVLLRDKLKGYQTYETAKTGEKKMKTTMQGLRVTVGVLVLGYGSSISLLGCATPGSSDRQPDTSQIVQCIQGCIEAVKAQDLESALSFFSEDFAGKEFADKGALRAFLTNEKQSGHLDGIAIELIVAGTTTIEEETSPSMVTGRGRNLEEALASMNAQKAALSAPRARSGPYSITGSFGTSEASVELIKMPKEGWRIIELDIAL